MIPIFEGQASVEDGTDRLSRNVGDYVFTMCNIPLERRSRAV